jgi:signal transduction histidine kinase
VLYNLTVMTDPMLERLHKLMEVVRNSGVTENIDSYLQGIISKAAELTESETASILEYNPEAKHLTFAVIPWFHNDALKNVKVPLEGSVAGWVVRQVRTLKIDDVSQDQRHYIEVDRISNFQTHSLLAVPLVLRGKVIGVIEVLNKAGNLHYTEEDVTILETLASLAALAMHDNSLENGLRTSDREFVELDRLKSDFIAITSHELRTPLGLILGHATFLREIVSTQYHEQLDAIIRNATKLKEIIESLSNVDNYQTGAARIRQRRVSIARIVEDVVSSFQEMAKQKGIEIRAAVSGGDLFVDADGSKTAIALSNLVKNAITFTNEGGKVLVSAEPATGFVKVSVADNGVGIPAADLPRVFERFFQVESHLTRKHGGMGLGLSVAKAMIEMHGGRIWVESVEGKGSNFIFLLPLDRGQTLDGNSSRVFTE